MSYIGDFRLGDTFDTKFCTVTTTGAPTSLLGTPVVSAYVGNSLVQITAGITLTVDFDAVTGLNNVRVVASSGNGYATASNYQLVITTGTVGGTSVVGYVVAEFSIENRSAVMPTTAPRTLDVSATGEAGIDWANIGAPTTAQTLSGTTVNDLTTKTGYALSAAGVDAIWDDAQAGHVTAGTFGLFLDTTVSSRSSLTAAQVNAEVDSALDTAIPAVNVADSVNDILLDRVKPNLDVVVSTRATPAQVKTQVVDALNVDTYAEPAQGTPAATNTLANKLSFLYKYLRNRITVTATTISVFNDDALTVDHKSTHSDDGTTYDRGEFATGP